MIIMYKRKEVIEEENLDWEDETRDRIQKKDVIVSLPSKAKIKNVLLDEENTVENKFDKQRNLMTYIDEYEDLSLGLTILLVPYLVGLLFNSLLFYVYSGITLDKVLTIEKEYKIFELWSIGAYTFITSWIIWILFKMLKEIR